MNLHGRVALVTGAGRRVGRALAVALGRERMSVAVHYNGSAEGAAETADLIRAAGGNAATFQCDLTTSEGPMALVQSVTRSMGEMDVVINSAAVMEHTPFGAVSTESWDRMLALNLRAPFFIAQSAAERMGDGGTIINISDLAAFESWPGYIPHAISKAGVVKMTSALARALAPRIRVNGIAPGAVLLPDEWTEEQGAKLAATTPLGRIGSPDDVVEAMLYLLRADYVTGETIVVDGGRHVRK